MFKKPLSNLKTFSPLRSSDRKRFQNEAYDAYPHIKERCSQEGASPLMPDTLRSAKFISHADQQGVVYVADNKPLWIKLEGLKPVPTVYTLWQHPDMLPILYTWSPVVRKLVEGADLMIPGLVPRPDGTLPDVKTNELVAITVKGYPYPLAVGTMALPTSEIRPRSGMKGKAVHIIHVYQDYLWKLRDQSDPPELEHLSDGEYEDEEEEEDDDDDDEKNAEETADSENKEEVPAKDQQQKSTEPAGTGEQKKLSVKEIDEILKRSLLHALQFKLTPENASSHLPISASVLYSSYVLPSRPRDVGNSVDIKGSSWKRVQKFLKAMEKAQVLKTKEQRGETMVMSINYSHPDFQGLQPYKTVEACAPSTQPSNAQKNSDSSGSNKTGEIEIFEVFKPMGNSVCAFFEAAGKNKDELFKAPDVKQTVQEYVSAKNIANPKNQRMINLDDLLADATLKKSEKDKISQLSREELVQRLQSQMQPFHVLILPGKEPVLRKGAPKPVSITQEIRQGRKTVTKVVGVEQYDIDVAELCKELTKLCASSATHDVLHGSSPKNPVHEIMVQGPQSKVIASHLQGLGVPKKMIQIDDKTNKKGKGKK